MARGSERHGTADEGADGGRRVRVGARLTATALVAVAAVLVVAVVVVAHADAAAPIADPRPEPSATPTLAAGPSVAVAPGTPTETPGAGICTTGFVFTAGERVLLGQAAHCAGTGDASETDGCTSATLPVGTPVTVHASGRTLAGTLRYSSWGAMRAAHERDPDTCAYNDFALVELPAGSAAVTSAALPLLGGPSGVRTAPLAPRTAVTGLAAPQAALGRTVLGARSGVTVGDGATTGGWMHTVDVARVGVPGESGAPLVDDAGRAVGLLSGREVEDPHHVQYTDLARALDYAARHGGPSGLALATAPGAAAG